MSDLLAAILLLVGVVVVAAWIGAAADAITRTSHEWTATGRNRGIWIAALVLFGAVLSPLYFFVVRPELDAATVKTPPDERTLVSPSVLDDVEPAPGVAKPDPILVVDGLRRQFGGLVAVNVDHLEVQRGLITGLIGPNGAGKTTMFNLLTGFDTPDDGEWRFNGMDMSGSVAHLMADRGMVRTFQLTKALARMTVLDNMMLGATGQRGEKFLAALVPPVWRHQDQEIHARAMSLLDRFGIEHMAHEYAGTLSGGQRKLLEMARALMTQPDLVMLDEPMAGVNPALTQSLLEHVKELRDEGMTVIFVEHDMDVVRDISDWVVVMAEGAIIAEGSHGSVTGNRDVIDAYLGTQHDDPVVVGKEGSVMAEDDQEETVTFDDDGLTDEQREADRAEVLKAAEERAASGEPLVEGDFLLEARGIVAGYVPGVSILNGCELELRDGEMVGVIGPNGAGKSTLIKALFGLLEVTEGTVTLRGQEITGMPAHELVARGIGYVPQRENVFPRLTVSENLEMGVYQRPESFADQKDRIVEMFPRLGERMDQRAGLLSGGERQMLAMARALTMEPSVLLLDEPSAGLSPALQDEVFQRTRTVNEAGVSVIMVEQNARRCLQICDRGYVLDQGQNAYTDTGQALLEDPKVIELYLGTLARAD